MLSECDYPLSLDLDLMTGMISPGGALVQRRVSDMKGIFYDRRASDEAIAQGDPLVYEFRNHKFLTSKSDMALAVTRIFPGKIGDEYHMSKGHLHERDDQPEMYICFQGSGYLLLDTLQGEFRAEPWKAGTVTHIPPMWAHRVVNTGEQVLVYAGVYHASAGHDYTLVEAQGFSKVVVERDGKPCIAAHPM
jgi:glucose-6-phosphate isomerase, archaeal